MSTESEDFSFPFQNEEVRKAWLEVLEYLEDDELPTLPYRDWIQVAKDTAFDVLKEELDSTVFSKTALEYLGEYMAWVDKLQTELMYLNRRNLGRS